MTNKQVRQKFYGWLYKHCGIRSQNIPLSARDELRAIINSAEITREEYKSTSKNLTTRVWRAEEE